MTVAIIAAAAIGVVSAIPGTRHFVSNVVRPTHRTQCQDSPSCRAYIQQQIRIALAGRAGTGPAGVTGPVGAKGPAAGGGSTRRPGAHGSHPGGTGGGGGQGGVGHPPVGDPGADGGSPGGGGPPPAGKGPVAEVVNAVNNAVTSITETVQRSGCKLTPALC